MKLLPNEVMREILSWIPVKPLLQFFQFRCFCKSWKSIISDPSFVELHIPDEVMREILSWIPVKPLLQFSCVCKSWKSIISEPSFVELHLQRSSKDANLILQFDTPDVVVGSDGYNTLVSCASMPLFENDAQDDYLLLDEYNILGSCNGLVCLFSDSFSGDPEHWEYWVRFWNPAMSLESKDSPSLHVDGLVNTTCTNFGFGYDKLGDTYKVVAVLNEFWRLKGDSKRDQVKVFTKGDHCWRDIQPFPALPLSRGEFISGTLNWLATTDISAGYEQLVIVSFDLGMETYKQFSLPICDEAFSFQPKIGVLGDCLCLSYDHKETHFVVWQMKELGVDKSWAQLVRVSYEHLQLPQPFCTGQHFYALGPLSISENGGFSMLLHRSEIIIYNRIDTRVERAKFRNRVWVWNHVQSLVLP